jgi:hypothetical protein
VASVSAIDFHWKRGLTAAEPLPIFTGFPVKRGAPCPRLVSENSFSVNPYADIQKNPTLLLKIDGQ